MMVNSSQHFGGARAQLLLLPLSENDTHCIQFSYFLYSRDGHSPGDLQVYIRVNGGSKGSAVWNVSGSQGRQWHQVELAVSTFWPSEYQVRAFVKWLPTPTPTYMSLFDLDLEILYMNSVLILVLFNARDVMHLKLKLWYKCAQFCVEVQKDVVTSPSLTSHLSQKFWESPTASSLMPANSIQFLRNRIILLFFCHKRTYHLPLKK